MEIRNRHRSVVGARLHVTAPIIEPYHRRFRECVGPRGQRFKDIVGTVRMEDLGHVVVPGREIWNIQEDSQRVVDGSRVTMILKKGLVCARYSKAGDATPVMGITCKCWCY